MKKLVMVVVFVGVFSQVIWTLRGEAQHRHPVLVEPVRTPWRAFVPTHLHVVVREGCCGLAWGGAGRP